MKTAKEEIKERIYDAVLDLINDGTTSNTFSQQSEAIFQQIANHPRFEELNREDLTEIIRELFTNAGMKQEDLNDMLGESGIG